MVEPVIESGTPWIVISESDHYTMRLDGRFIYSLGPLIAADFCNFDFDNIVKFSLIP